MVILLVSVLTRYINEQVNNSALRTGLWLTTKIPKKGKLKISVLINVNNSTLLRRVPINNKITIKAELSEHILQPIPEAFSLIATFNPIIKTINLN